MKVFLTTSMDVIAECRYWFGLLEMETLIAKRKQRFMAKYIQSDNVLYQLFAHVESVYCVTCGIICFFLFSLCSLYLFFSCLLPINLVNKVDYMPCRMNSVASLQLVRSPPILLQHHDQSHQCCRCSFRRFSVCLVGQRCSAGTVISQP